MNQIIDKACNMTNNGSFDRYHHDRSDEEKADIKRDSFRIFSGKVWEDHEFSTALDHEFSNGCNIFFENSEPNDHIDYFE